MSPPTVVVLAQEAPSTNMLCNHLAREVGVSRVVFEQPVPRSEFLRRRARRLGRATVAGQVAFQALAVPLLERRAHERRAELIARHGLDDAPVDRALVERVPSVNDDATIALLRRLEPDVVVLSGTRIVGERVLRAVEVPFLNVHTGITPRYRGVHGGYWALAAGDREHCGVTVHVVDPGVDTGAIVAQARIEPGPADNFTTYPLLQLAAGLPLLADAVRAAAAGRLETRPATGPSAQWSHPTLRRYIGTRVRRGVR